MAKRLLNPYYDRSAEIGFSWPNLVAAIVADMQAHPEKRLYTLQEIVAIASAAGIDTAGHLTLEMVDWLVDENTGIVVINV